MKKQTANTPVNKSVLVRILGYVWKYPFSLIGSLLCAVITVAGTLLVPVFLGDAIESWKAE